MRTKKGIVVTAKDKTLKVKVTRKVLHPKYHKAYEVVKHFHAHDPESKFQVGDTVTIYETRPISKLKRWTVVIPK
jgi:small subunit ribosomal protein S17